MNPKKQGIKNAKYIRAHANGQVVQFRHKDLQKCKGTWFRVRKQKLTIFDRDDLEFRVKPEPEKALGGFMERERQRLSNVKRRRQVVVFVWLMVALWAISITAALFCS